MQRFDIELSVGRVLLDGAQQPFVALAQPEHSWACSQEVPSWSSRSFRTTKATRPANSPMPSCTSPTACSKA
jgi:hypothetical protein